MKSRLVMFAAFALAIAAIAVTVSRLASSPASPPAAKATLPPSPASYLGVYAAGAPPAYSPINRFGKAGGKDPNMVGYYSGWAEPFAAAFAQDAHSHGAVPYVQIDPTLASVPGIAAGAYDGYLRSYADSVRDFGHAVVIGFGHEMNAPWYSWGYGHVPAATFVAAWRHMVRLFHDQGADNVTWLWTLQADQPGTGAIRDWWPGAAYVTWVGIDGYYTRPADTFASVFGRTIRQVRSFASKPVILSETAVGPAAGQFQKIGNLFAGMQQYKTLGLVWFDLDNGSGAVRQDWRIEDSSAAEAAFRLGVSALNLARP
ncbi:MAG TPA: glycosyl hydrolase [Streptosporangiaceae bacterium]|jgi:hypothetical protein